MGNNLKKRIMKKVYAIWFFRKVSPALFLYLPFLMLVAFRETADTFFVAEIVRNFLVALNGGIVSTFKYVASAVANTPVVPTLIILFSLAAFAALVFRVTQNVKNLHLARSF